MFLLFPRASDRHQVLQHQFNRNHPATVNRDNADQCLYFQSGPGHCSLQLQGKEMCVVVIEGQIRKTEPRPLSLLYVSRQVKRRLQLGLDVPLWWFRGWPSEWADRDKIRGAGAGLLWARKRRGRVWPAKAPACSWWPNACSFPGLPHHVSGPGRQRHPTAEWLRPSLNKNLAGLMPPETTRARPDGQTLRSPLLYRATQ